MLSIAIVTGASSGIGQAIASVLLEHNYRVYGLSRTKPKNQTLITHPEFTSICIDLTNTNSLLDCINDIKKEGPISLLVNNAGVGYYGPHEELNIRKLHEMVMVNVEVPLLLSNLLLRDLKKMQGTIINISSVTATKANPHGCAYGATKAALSNFSTSLFEETRKYGVRIVTIQPDMTKTNLYRNANFHEADEPDTYLCPDEVAEAVRYALSVRPGILIRELTLQPQKHQIKRKVVNKNQ